MLKLKQYVDPMREHRKNRSQEKPHLWFMYICEGIERTREAGIQSSSRNMATTLE